MSQIKDLFGEGKSEKEVLHIAPEWSLRKRLSKKYFKTYITGDLNSPLVDKKVDITAIPFEDSSFDVVICNHVLEHVIDDQKAMKEIFRVLKSGGYAVLQIPFTEDISESIEDNSAYDWTNDERETAFGQWDHIRIYSRADYVKRLVKSGFEVEEFSWTNDSRLSELGKTYALHPREIVFNARRV